MQKQYRALILDMDGTLLDSHSMVMRSFRQLAEEYGIEPTERHYSLAFGSVAEDLMVELGLDDPNRAAERWREIMVDMLDTVPLFAGAQALLAAPIRRGVVTSQCSDELARNLGRLGIGGLFEFTVSVDATPYCKPHPRPLLYCLEQMGLEPQQALFVGDSNFDYGCAKSAGVDFGLACWGAEHPDGFPDAEHHFQTPEEILELIERQ